LCYNKNLFKEVSNEEEGFEAPVVSGNVALVGPGQPQADCRSDEYVG
jgi:hypothetical protein